MRTVLILRLIRITTLVSGDARGRSLDDLWTTGCSRQRRTTARHARSAIFTGTYTDARTRLDRLTELLIDLNDLHNRCEPTERRILNRALFTRITIDDEENATYTPDKTTASVLAHTSIDALSEVTAETSLPRQFPGGADLRGGGARGIRTPALLIANETRYQLRHSPKCGLILASPSGVLASSVAVSPPTAPGSPGGVPRERPALLAGCAPPLEDRVEVDGVEELLLILHRSGNVAAGRLRAGGHRCGGAWVNHRVGVGAPGCAGRQRVGRSGDVDRSPTLGRGRRRRLLLDDSFRRRRGSGSGGLRAGDRGGRL